MIKHFYENTNKRVNFKHVVLLVSGILLGYAQEGSPGWNININQAKMQHEGNYICTVTTDKGIASAEYHLLVLCKFI